MDETVVALRMAERILAVAIGGVAIYLGYRLFFHLPFDRSDQGELELPGLKIVLSRVGPGVFFAAFGTLVLYYSLTNEVSFNDLEGFVGASAGVASQPLPPEAAATPQQRSKALTSIEMLNCADRLLSRDADAQGLGDQLSLAIRDAKRALMLAAWNPEDWGSTDVLAVTGPTGDAPLSVRLGFEAIYGGCPQ